MGELDQILSNAKANLTPIKEQAKNAVTDAKARLLAATPQPAGFKTNLKNAFQEGGDLVRNASPDPRRIVKQQDNVILREDGSISIVTHDNKILDNVNPDRVPELLAREQAKLQEIQAGASNNTVLDRAAGTIQSGVDVVKGLASSAFGISDELNKTSTGKGTVGGTEQTLSAAVNKFNSGIRANAVGGSLNIPADAEIISPNALEDYRGVVKSINEGILLTPAQEEFSKSNTFKTIFNLEGEVAKTNRSFKKIENAADFVKSFVPTKRSDDISASLAFERIAENEGTLAAIKNTLTNDVDVLIGQGIESIPYMIAFTVGGPVTQIGVLGGLSKSKAREMTESFIEENGREPSIKEQSRIDMFSAVSTVAEKFGDMVALGVITRAKLPRILNTKKIVESVLPESIKKLIQTPVARGSLAATGLSTKVGQRVAKALTGEGASGAITSAADQIALTGTINDTSQIAFDALSEAVGTVGGVGTILAGRTANSVFNITKDTVQNLKDSAQDTPNTAKTTSSNIEDSLVLQDKEPVNTERIEVNKFDKAIDDIKDLANNITPESIKESFFQLSRLAKRALTEEQAAIHKATLDAHIKKLKDIGTRGDTTLGSLGPINELTPEDLQELSVNQDTTEADKIFINSIIEAQELADEIEADSTNTQKTEIKNKSTVVEDFNNLLTAIRGVSSDSTFSTPETKATRTNNLISQLGTQLTNIENKLAAVIAASKFTPAAGKTAAIRSTRINPEDPNDLSVEFSEPISLSEAEIIEEENQDGVSIIRIDNSSTDQVDTLTKEVEFGNLIVDLAQTHQNTSFAQTAAQQQTVQRLASEAVKQLESQESPIISNEKTEQEIDNIKDPTKPKETKKPVKKTIAQEFIDPTLSTDPVVINRKLWENKQVTVTNDDGSTESVLAGKLWDSLHKDLEMAENLLECVKS